MRMATYVIRRLILVIPVLMGVVTVTFLLFASLPIPYQLLAAWGPPNPHQRCGYNPSCQCSVIGTIKSTSHGVICQCPAPPIVTTPNGICPNPVYSTDVHKLGLDQPIFLQWAKYIYRSFTFHWGNVSNFSAVGSAFPVLKGVSVATALSWELPYTLELATLALMMILAVAIPLGNASAVNRNRPIDQMSRVMSFSGYALPAFLLGSFVIAGLTVALLPYTGILVHSPWCRSGEALNLEFTYSWPPSTNCYVLQFGYNWPQWMANGIHTTPTGVPTLDAALNHQYWLALDSLIRLLLPAFVIAYGTIATLLRFVRNSMLEVMNLDYVRTARAKGVPEKIVTSKHAGRNSMNVTVTVLGLTFAGFVGGFPVIEDVFSLNGVGRVLAVAAIPAPTLDFSLIFGSTLLFTFLVVGANIIVDVLYAYLDPRVRLG